MSRMKQKGKADAMRKRWCAPAMPHGPPQHGTCFFCLGLSWLERRSSAARWLSQRNGSREVNVSRLEAVHQDVLRAAAQVNHKGLVVSV